MSLNDRIDLFLISLFGVIVSGAFLVVLLILFYAFLIAPFFS